jgi:Uma2 family endonuclease
MMPPPMPKVELGRLATYDDLVAVPDHLVAEIVDDELWTSPRPAPRHATAASLLGAVLTMGFGAGRPPGGWRILAETELHLGAHTVVPDIAGWRLERMPKLPETAYFSLAPDWVCEVLSPSTALLDRAKKLRIYAEAGVAYAWLVDPLLRSIEVLRRDATGHWTLLDTRVGAVVVHAEPFAAVEVDLALLWSE